MWFMVSFPKSTESSYGELLDSIWLDSSYEVTYFLNSVSLYSFNEFYFAFGDGVCSSISQIWCSYILGLPLYIGNMGSVKTQGNEAYNSLIKSDTSIGSNILSPTFSPFPT